MGAKTFLITTRLPYPWTMKFWNAIKLNDGHMIATLGEARVPVLSLPASQQEELHWEAAAELLKRAADSPSAMDDALAAMLHALKLQARIRRAVVPERSSETFFHSVTMPSKGQRIKASRRTNSSPGQLPFLLSICRSTASYVKYAAARTVSSARLGSH